VQTVYYLVLVVMVYAAMALFIIGTVWQGVRIFRGLRHSLATTVGPPKPPQLRGALCDTFLRPRTFRTHPVHWVLLIAFHAALLLLFLGHLELIGEIGVLQTIQHEVFLGRGVVGITLLVTVLFFIFRRFHAPISEISDPGSYYTLILLLLVILFGSQLHLARSLFAYSTVDVEQYREYLTGMLTFRPALPDVFADDMVGHSFLLVLHVFCANLFLMLFPLTRMMHALLAIPLARLQRR